MGVLDSKENLSRFIRSLSTYGLCNCSGAAYRSQCWAIARNGIVLITDGFDGYIAIADDPSHEIRPGCQDSRVMNISAYPKCPDGELITVWRRGEWVKEGPWVLKIRLLIEKLEVELRYAKARAERKIYLNYIDAKRVAKEREEALHSAWGEA